MGEQAARDCEGQMTPETTNSAPYGRTTPTTHMTGVIRLRCAPRDEQVYRPTGDESGKPELVEGNGK